MKITLVAGARPNFIKIAPIIAELNRIKALGKDINYRLVHTGQHYDDAMSGQFFRDLEIPLPDVNLNCGGGSQAEQTAQILIAFEKELIENPTDLVLVVGDVTSTMACSITAKKLNTKVAHVEAGIRSGDMKMPEEINRIVTDSISDYFFTTSQLAGQNLLQIGKSQQQIFFVGNVMIDTLLKFKPKFKAPQVYNQHKLTDRKYLVLTLHRPSNVDEADALKRQLDFICEQARNFPIVFPIHPRTQQQLELTSLPKNLIITSPLGYLEFNYLIQNSLGVLTDSGGITEETSIMNIPCITLRENTERPETIEFGTNVLVGKDLEKLKYYMQKLLSNQWKQSQGIELWDGKAAERIIKVITNTFIS